MAENIEKPKDLSVEHVLPQKWTNEWPFPNGQTDADEPDARDRRALVNSLGNLTLLTRSLNSSSGNSGFTKKKEKFEEQTGLFLNKWFTNKDQWTETEISERSKHLAKMAAKIWIDLE